MTERERQLLAKLDAALRDQGRRSVSAAGALLELAQLMRWSIVALIAVPAVAVGLGLLMFGSPLPPVYVGCTIAVAVPISWAAVRADWERAGRGR